MPESKINEHKAPPENKWERKSFVDQAVEHLCTPYYIPTNKHWEITFRALDFSRSTIESFWAIFYRINKAHNGSITIIEFLNYFNLERTVFIERCFEYFDCTGDDKIGFLEFMISVFNICTLNIDTLTRFAFDIFDVSGREELSLPEIERMVQELYGDNIMEVSTGRDVLMNINHFAEERGGILNLTAFTIYTGNHSLLLMPVFRIQRIIQSSVMGLPYWRRVERLRPDVVTPKHKSVFNARYVQTLLRKYKEGGASAMLSYCGDPDDELLKLYQKKERNEKVDEEECTKSRDTNLNTTNLKNAKFKDAVSKIKKINDDKRNQLKNVLASAKNASHRTIDTTATVFSNAGSRSRKSLVRITSSLRKPNSNAKSTANFKDSAAQRIPSPPINRAKGKQGVHFSISEEQISQAKMTQNPQGHNGERRTRPNTATNKEVEISSADSPRIPRRHRQRRPAPNNVRSRLQRQPSHLGSIGDHRLSFTNRERLRTPGSVVFTKNDDI